eukprot:scaffold17919_cov48-Cyclotella_meneghiniana.AAC.1
MESKSFTKVKGGECFMFEADTPNKEAIAVVDIGILGCGEALTYLEDESSSTGARCQAIPVWFLRIQSTILNLSGRIP